MKKRMTAISFTFALLLTLLCACEQQKDGGASSQELVKEPVAEAADGGENMPIDTEGTMLFDYYRASVTAGESTYSQITTNEADKRVLYLNVYSGSRAQVTTMFYRAYKVSSTVLPEVLAVVDRYDMAGWNNEDGVGIDGLILVVKFLGDDGNLIRVSTDKSMLTTARNFLMK